ncbi:uncharacterized protein EHS24_006582 [Apiotrichum porosum]|uniref:Uncharacterized protein n=1 Tax=Apiotrichum porosum TaxID=105984 RepID=A0A427Y1H1_9TREE|nr:uncharacterized protein EHS24_006582 [Apiotrichum porosum]RSH85004.1 hypothetical protein EHS24_006582 [Apiotrichum porosum]
MSGGTPEGPSANAGDPHSGPLGLRPTPAEPWTAELGASASQVLVGHQVPGSTNQSRNAPAAPHLDLCVSAIDPTVGVHFTAARRSTRLGCDGNVDGNGGPRAALACFRPVSSL